MAFGISAGAIFSAVAPTVVGGLMGGKKGATDQVSTNAKSMDPRIDSRYFGEGGLLSDLDKWYSANKTGINPDMQAGLDHMKSVYQSPLATQGYERMGNVGYDLMGRGVAGNPFLTGNMPNFGNLQLGQQAQPAQPAQLMQPTQNLGLSSGWATPAEPVAPVAPAAPAQQNPLSTQDQFRQMYEEEMRRQQRANPDYNRTDNLGN